MENIIKNSEAYLDSVLGKETGFSIPNNYFASTEEKISTKLSEESFTKEPGFTMPDAYFKDLENDILAKVSPTKEETKVISLKEKFFKIIPIAAAASVILFIGLNSFVFNNDKELNLDSLSDDDIEFWLDSNTLNNNDIAAVLEDDILDESDFYFSSLEDKNIEDYINSIDNSSFLNEIN